MVDEASAIGAILLLTLVTIATRMGGVWIMSYIEITPRIEAFLKYMGASVLISIVVPATLAATPRMWLAVGAAALVTIATRNALGAMVVGTVVAAFARSFSL
ncbi:Branched-chain amino acid transport protein (AzlD) [Rhizobiales bacterium GAS191]|nr:Branched-chain amino acid transport protein (AzlD) [Rhizobiales bacterium GAS191]